MAPPTPLDGLLIADFSRVLAGPFATMFLGDLGADVVKVERPDSGDDTRAWGPPFKDAESTYFLGLNRNKRSLALDLANESDRELAYRLATRADVLIESFRPGLMEQWGLDGDTVRRDNPKLVSCSINAFGSAQEGRELPGYDLLVQAAGGLMSITGEPDGRPVKVGAAVIDLICGLVAVSGITAALFERESNGGRGRHIEVSLYDCALTSLLNQASAWLMGGVIGQRLGNQHPSIAPYETFEASDRPFALAVGNDRLFVRMCETIGAGELGTDSRFTTNALRVENRGELTAALQTIFSGATADEWIELLQSAKVPAGPINNVAEAFALADQLKLEMTQKIDDLLLPTAPLRIDGTRPPIRHRPPHLDEHGDELRAWLLR